MRRLNVYHSLTLMSFQISITVLIFNNIILWKKERHAEQHADHE